MITFARLAVLGGVFANMGPNELLLLLSARKAGSWYQFRSCVDEVLGEEDSGVSGLPLHQRIRVNLSRMAHVEFTDSEDTDQWRAAPPVLAVTKTPSGFGGILCGARSLHLLDSFRTASAALSVETISLTACPDAMRVFSSSIAGLECVARAVGIQLQHEAAASLLSILDPIGHLHLGPSQDLPFGKDMTVEYFAAERHRYRWLKIESGGRLRADGLYRCTRWQQPQHYLRSGGKFMLVAGQLGKFIILNGLKRNVFRFDRQNWTLKVPAMCRPPALIDRALHLCSGILPSEASSKYGLLLTYHNIAPGIASLAADLLGQKLA
jgi:hypothetical protein